MAVSRTTVPLDMGDRAIIDGESERRFGHEVERLGESAADRAAMGDGDDVAPGIALLEAADRAFDAVEQVDEALAALRRHAGRGEPEAMIGLAEQRRQIDVFLAMPVAEALLVERRHDDDAGPGAAVGAG